MSSFVQARRFLLIALVLTSAAVVVCEDDPALGEDAVEPDFSDPALSEDPVATGPHSDVEPAWIIPDCPDGKVPVGGSTDLVVALANAGSTMFNVSHIEGKLTTSTGKTVKELPRYEYGQNLGPREQRSFRFPVPIDAEMPLGEYTLVAQAYYSTHKKKEPFVSAVLNEPIELVPPLPDKEAQMMRAIQLGLAALAISLLGLAVTRIFGGGSGASGKPGKKAASKEGADPKTENEWLAGTLAGTENRGQRKAKKKA